MSKLQSIYRHHNSELLALLLFFVGGILGLLGLGMLLKRRRA